MENLSVLDVTVIEPKFKHPRIFEKFDSLNAGEAFVIHNDHDPKPLYYQLLGERGNIFSWDYLEEGPEWWKVKIAKNGDDGKGNVTVGEIAAKDYRKAEVFKRMGIDFCCGGKKTVAEACEEAGVSEAELERELANAEVQHAAASHDFTKWAPDFLADYIVNTHHNYLKQNLDLIYQMGVKVANHHGESHPELVDVVNSYVEIANELAEHMKKEEEVLFPYVKELAKAKAEGRRPSATGFGTVTNPVSMMEDEHEAVGKELLNMRKISKDYTLPEDACNSYTYLYEKLKEFENDLHLHIHLENNILFPAAIKMERELVK